MKANRRTVRLGDSAIALANVLAKRFGLSQADLVQTALVELSRKYAAADSLPKYAEEVPAIEAAVGKQADPPLSIADRIAALKEEDARQTAARLMAASERRESNRGRITVHGLNDEPPYEKPERPAVGRKKSSRQIVREPFV